MLRDLKTSQMECFPGSENDKGTQLELPIDAPLISSDEREGK